MILISLNVCLEPSVPRSVDVSFLSSSSLQVTWVEPFYPNGEITHYVVKYRESDSSHLWKGTIDWCTNVDLFYKKIKVDGKEGRCDH